MAEVPLKLEALGIIFLSAILACTLQVHAEMDSFLRPMLILHLVPQKMHKYIDLWNVEVPKCMIQPRVKFST